MIGMKISEIRSRLRAMVKGTEYGLACAGCGLRGNSHGSRVKKDRAFKRMSRHIRKDRERN